MLFEDEWLLAVDKPSGMAVHPGAGVRDGTLTDWIRDYLGRRAVRNDFVASPVHRLDRETSGVVLIAKRRPAMVKLAAAFEAREVRKQYRALAVGVMEQASGRIDAPLSDPGGRRQSATTEYEVLQRFASTTLLECRPRTGRRHQIRRHLAGIGHPLAGDRQYGAQAINDELARTAGLNRLFLHATRLEARHPRDGSPLVVESELAPDLAAVLFRIGN